MDDLILSSFLEDKKIVYRRNIPLADVTWIKRGGRVSFWIQPESCEQLTCVVIFLYKNGSTFDVVGNTSNCFFTETYNPNIIVSTLRVNEIDFFEDSVVCGCGYNLMKLSKYCVNNGIANYEGFAGLPGTVGGATINNAGSYGSVISDVVRNVTILAPNGEIKALKNDEMCYRHRSSLLKENPTVGIVIKVEFDITKREDVSVLRKKAELNKQHRKRYQEQSYPNLGSIHSKLDIWSRHLVRKIIYVGAMKSISYFVKDQRRVQKIGVVLLLFLFLKLSMRKYVSSLNINCFVWKNDSYMDSDFFNYLSFIKSIAYKSQVEIQIKNENRHTDIFCKL